MITNPTDPSTENMPTADEIFSSPLSSVQLTTRPLLMQLLERAKFLNLAKGAHAEDLRDALERLKSEIMAARLDAIDLSTVIKLVLDHLAKNGITNARPLVRAVLGELLTAPAAGKTDTSSSTITLTDDEPAVEPVNGATLLDETAALVRRYVVLPRAEADATALWIGAAHAIDALQLMPLLLVSAPVSECGKTTLATVIGGIVPRMIMVSSLTPAVLFRMIHKYRPTLIADEVDSWLSDDNSELRGIFNAAHWRAGAVIPRCVGDAHEVELFNVFGAKLIAMIGRPTATMLSRSITISLRRKTAGERVEPLREHCLRADLAPLRQGWRRWVLDHPEALRTHEPTMPAELPVNRASDNWRPLLLIADLAGGDWPARARAAALALSGVRVFEDESVNVMLLADVREVFRVRGEPEYLSSEDIIVTLRALPQRQWSDWNNGRGITPSQFAKRLRDFGTGPHGLRTRETRTGDKTGKRWHREDFADAWSRYVPADPPHSQQTNKSWPSAVISDPQQSTDVARPETPVQPVFTRVVAEVAPSAPDPDAQKGSSTEGAWLDL